jgi:hypothetical protein
MTVDYRPWPPIARIPDRDVADAVGCDVCAAKRGQWCDGSRIPRWESLHFARRAAAEKALALR